MLRRLRDRRKRPRHKTTTTIFPAPYAATVLPPARYYLNKFYTTKVPPTPQFRKERSAPPTATPTDPKSPPRHSAGCILGAAILGSVGAAAGPYFPFVAGLAYIYTRLTTPSHTPASVLKLAGRKHLSVIRYTRCAEMRAGLSNVMRKLCLRALRTNPRLAFSLFVPGPAPGLPSQAPVPAGPALRDRGTLRDGPQGHFTKRGPGPDF